MFSIYKLAYFPKQRGSPLAVVAKVVSCLLLGAEFTPKILYLVPKTVSTAL